MYIKTHHYISCGSDWTLLGFEWFMGIQGNRFWWGHRSSHCLDPSLWASSRHLPAPRTMTSCSSPASLPCTRAEATSRHTRHPRLHPRLHHRLHRRRHRRPHPRHHYAMGGSWGPCLTLTSPDASSRLTSWECWPEQTGGRVSIEGPSH